MGSRIPCSPGTPPPSRAPQPGEQHFSSTPRAGGVRCIGTPSGALQRQRLNSAVSVALLQGYSSSGHTRQAATAPGLCSDGGCAQERCTSASCARCFGRCIPAWCQRAMSHYLPNLCLHCILQVSVTPGLYPAARVSICINLSPQTSLFCRGNKLSVEKMQLR